MNKRSVIRPLFLLLVIGSSVMVASHLQRSRSANLTQVAAVSSNSRHSFVALLGTNTVGSSTVVINITPGADKPSTDAAQLVQGDVVAIGNAATISPYTVGSTADNTAAAFSITSTLASGDTEAGDWVIATASSSLTVKLRTTNAIGEGQFRILVPALPSNANAADGLPDSGFFDFSAAGATVTCPADVTSYYNFVAGTASASAITVAGLEYHSFECHYSDPGFVNQDFITAGNNFVISGLINPAPKTTHITGTADTYKIIVQNMKPDGSIIDQTPISIGLVEAVRVTATVSPQISFSIIGVNSGTSACGISTATGINTTSTLVPFGDLLISSFTTLAQTLAVSTNAANGFAVTAVENDQLGRNGVACTGDPTTNADCIQDSTGDNGTMTHLVSADWNVAANKGFAFALHDSGGTTTEAFAYDESTRAFSARQFADAEGSQSPVQIFSATTPVDNDWLYVCYRAVIPATQAAGNYENFLTYTATATF